MRRASSWLSALSSCLLAAGAYAADPTNPPAEPEGVQPVAAVSTPADPELQRMLEQLSQLSEYLGRNPQAPQAYRYQLSQAEVLLQLAVRGKGEERDRWLRMAVDSEYGAALQCPDNDLAALQRMQQMPAQIARAYPDSPVAAYAALQEIKVRYNRAIIKAGENPSRLQQHYCTLLLRFAQAYPPRWRPPRPSSKPARPGRR